MLAGTAGRGIGDRAGLERTARGVGERTLPTGLEPPRESIQVKLQALVW